MTEFINADATSPEKNEAAVCPLCQKQNQCVMAGEQNLAPTQCWCMHLDEKVPDELLDRIPPEQRGQACICQQCIQRFWSGEMP